ncbi:MAG: ATP-binding protein [Balneolales bacterium]|nr:ATP-binding protein [Balneolales bacterium]
MEDSKFYATYSVIHRFFVIGFFLILFGTHATVAQKYNIKRYSVNEGLPSGNVYDVHTDDMGYIWFATSYGLVRYDGSDYEVLGVNEGLKDDLLYSFYFDESGYVWVSTETGGVAKFDRYEFTYLPELSVLDTMVVNYITGRKDELWFGTNEHGVFIWNYATNQFKKITEEEGLPSNQVWDIYFSGEDTWISSVFGIALYSEREGIIKSYTQEDGIGGEYTYQVIEGSNGNLWIATSNGVSIVKENGEIENITELNGVELGYIFSVVEDDAHKVWIGTERQGVFIYDDKNPVQIKKANGLSSNFVNRLVKDTDGTIWIATDGDGVNVFKDMNFKFYDKNSELGAASVYSSTISRKGIMWLGTDQGLVKFETGTFKKFPIPEPYYQDDEIWDIEELPNGNLLLLTYTYELLEFDGERFFRPGFYDTVSDYYINDILVQEDGSIYLSSFGALIYINNGEAEFFIPPDDEYWQQALGIMFKDSRDILWIATEGGVSRFINGEFEFFTSEHGVVGNSIFEIVEDQDGNLWIGSNVGISVLKKEQASSDQLIFQEFYNEGIFAGETVFLQFDHKGGLWQGTNAGLNYIDLNGWGTNEYSVKQIHFPLTEYGRGMEFNGAAKEIDENGNVWFGTNSGGLISYQFDASSDPVVFKDAPETYLRSIRSNGEIIFDQLKSGKEPRPVLIDYNFNDLSFHFSAAEFINTNSVSYKYMLQGFDNNWKTGVDIDQVQYTNLDPGNYSLMVSAKSTKSDWSEPASLISFNVKKPFYLTIWFFVLSGLALIGVVLAFVSSRINKLEKVELQHLVDKRTEDLKLALDEKEVLIKEIHHRVKNNLAVVSGLLELQGFRIPQGPAKQALVESRMRVIAMSKIHENLYQNSDLANVDFRKFINDLVRGVHATYNQFDKNIEVIQYIDELHMNVNLGVPIALITNELVSNCYKHAFANQEEGTITIMFSKNEQDYVLEVKDNGYGSDKDLLEIRTKSLGMTLIKSLAAQVRGDLRYNGNEGSHFVLTVPKEGANFF